MASYDHKVDFLTQEIVKFIESNEIDLDNDDHMKIVTDYIYDTFRIRIPKTPIRNRINNLK
jgi:hypothetical protein